METRSASDIEESTERLLQELKDILRDGDDLLRARAEDVSEQGSVAREKLAAALDSARETQRRLQQRAIAGVRATDRLVREHPYQAVGIGFGVGLLIGVLACRR